jgi:hypothetical protein
MHQKFSHLPEPVRGKELNEVCGVISIMPARMER